MNPYEELVALRDKLAGVFHAMDNGRDFDGVDPYDALADLVVQSNSVPGTDQWAQLGDHVFARYGLLVHGDVALQTRVADRLLAHLSRYATTVYDEVARERARAHAKHGAESIEKIPADDPRWLAILTEEVGEVAKALNEGTNLSEELVQVAAVAIAWREKL